MGFGYHGTGSLRTHVSRGSYSGVAHAPRSGQGVASKLADAFLDVAESFRGLGLAAPLDFTGIYVDRP